MPSSSFSNICCSEYLLKSAKIFSTQETDSLVVKLQKTLKTVRSNVLIISGSFHFTLSCVPYLMMRARVCVVLISSAKFVVNWDFTTSANNNETFETTLMYVCWSRPYLSLLCHHCSPQTCNTPPLCTSLPHLSFSQGSLNVFWFYSFFTMILSDLSRIQIKLFSSKQYFEKIYFSFIS